MAATKKSSGAKEYMNGKVPVILPPDKNKGSLSVTVNGTTMLVPRGRQVFIPRKYALIIEESMRQEVSAQAYCDSAPNKKSK